MSKKLKAVKFSQVTVGQQFQRDGATAWNVKIDPVPANTKSGFVNCIERGGVVRSFVVDGEIVRVKP